MLVLVLSALFSCEAFAQATISSFEVSGGPIVGGSDQFLTGTVTLANAGNGPTPIVFDGTPGTIVECDHQSLTYGFGCWAFGSSLTVKFSSGPCVSSSVVKAISAEVEYSLQRPSLFNVVVEPFHIGLSVPDTMTSGQQNGAGKVTLDAKVGPGGAVGVSVTSIDLLRHALTVVIGAGQSSARRFAPRG